MNSKFKIQVMEQNKCTIKIFNEIYLTFGSFILVLAGMQRPRRVRPRAGTYAELPDLDNCDTSDDSTSDDDEIEEIVEPDDYEHLDRYWCFRTLYWIVLVRCC